MRAVWKMKKALHSVAGAIALATILAFWTATVMSEFSGHEPLIRSVKTAIPWGLLILIPAIAATGMTGTSLAKGRTSKPIARKRRRMPIIALNGICVLIPAALFLAAKASAGEYDQAFIIVQVLECVAGAVNIALMGLNMRDGRRITRRRRASPLPEHSTEPTV